MRTPAFQKLVDDMIETMVEYDGIGLAAPQVHESVRLFVAGVEGSGDNLKIVPFINPVIEPIGDRDGRGLGRLPEHPRSPRQGAARRARSSSGRSIGAASRSRWRSRTIPARVVQHETDHLDGVLFLDRMASLETLTFLDEFQRYRHSGDRRDESDLRRPSDRRSRPAPPSVTLRNAPPVPYDGAIAAARTCYAPRVIGPPRSPSSSARRSAS